MILLIVESLSMSTEKNRLDNERNIYLVMSSIWQSTPLTVQMMPERQYFLQDGGHTTHVN